jgi:GDP-L-fucose synthase
MADFSYKGKKVFVAGEQGMVGRALTRALAGKDVQILSAPRAALDLTDQKATFDWLAAHRPDAVFVAAAKVGGIHANNTCPADFIRDNLAIASNVIEGAHRAGVQHLLFLGSSCIYPRDCPQPIKEEYLLTRALEPTNEAYAIAKIAGLKMCEFYTKQYGRRYMSAMPTNLYGPYDRFDEKNSHVIPALMMRFHKAMEEGARQIEIWGSGKPLREFLHVDDLARALVIMMERWDGLSHWNIGSGEEVSIAALARMMAEVTGFRGEIIFDPSMPDGTPRKFLDSSRIMAAGWAPKVRLEEGLREVYEWYKENISNKKAA